MTDTGRRTRNRKPYVHPRPRMVVHLPADLLRAIDVQAREQGRTRTSEVIRALTRLYLASDRGQQPEG
jgi:metal-responsive CopG/Arc/MetJ family transcriptional regulator